MMDTAEAARATLGRLEGENVRFSGVSTDSRSVAAGDLFIALKGERFDGHEYVPRAEQQGAAASMVSRRVEGAKRPEVVVDDTRLALGRLAAHWRARFPLPVVALTGSNGKTTVKEMLASILAVHVGARDPVLATEGNLNNDIGMPLTLLKLRGKHRYAVIEMGMNHEGEIGYLTRIARPTVALVNNAQRAHVGILGSVEAIARAKGEIYAGLDANGVAVVNEDDAFAAYWSKLNTGRRIVTFGFSARASVRGSLEEGRVHVVTPDSAFFVALQVAGDHNVRNALAACAAAHALRVPATAMQEGLQRFPGVPGRLQRRAGLGGGWVIDDTYNANPESMKAAVKVLAAEPGRRVFVMGDMGELGDEAPSMHAEVGEFARGAGIDALIAIGAASAHAVRAFGPGAHHFEAVDAARDAARAEAAAGATVLVKGSRFMQMERVADALAAPGGSNAA
ncbi:MAG TPA: UDP-N-acetylmuramoyl-tripeptide--D-alanyl-D-alanine ligase [Usitatibacter sp.]|jgi:UDP-N-acetylmuramoyl-tripeptide--D-alanyl-D-alanine ligase|nr:UDP-N-acetylmuramoyl-tripeptide--D-alanyl-D-alanine ligase [Usitatibacter sp.]